MKRSVGAAIPLKHVVPAIRETKELINGYHIPMLGLGTYRANPKIVAEAVIFAIGEGFRHFDCAPIYGNQKEVGEGLKIGMKRFNVKREDIFISSKLWPTHQRPDLVESACRATLQELQLDYLDLLLPHWPVCWKHVPVPSGSSEETINNGGEGPVLRHPVDPDTGIVLQDTTVSLEQTWHAMELLVTKEKLVRSLGLSNANWQQVRSCQLAGKEVWPVANQIELHPSLTQPELVSTMTANGGVLPIAYCPLATPTRFTPKTYLGLCEHPLIQVTAKNVGLSPQQMLLSWNLACTRPVLVKSTSKDHIAMNAKVHRDMLDQYTRFLITQMENVIPCRVINPTNFKIGTAGKEEPFFPPVKLPKGPTPEMLKLKEVAEAGFRQKVVEGRLRELRDRGLIDDPA